jgi:predicted MFS family arabinose efflux permease
MSETPEGPPSASRAEVGSAASAILVCTAGTTVYLILPLFVGVAADHVGLSDRQVGYLASFEVAGIGLASLLAATWQRRVSWSRAAGLSLALIALGNLLSIQATSAGSLFAIRFLTGLLGHGPAYALGLASLGEQREPERAFLQLTATQVAYAAAALWGLPYVVESWGFAGMLVALACMVVLVVPVTRRLPRRSAKAHASAPGMHGAGSRLPLVALVFHTVFFAGVGSVWAYAERMGSASGLDSKQVGMALAVATALSFVGILLASRVGNRYGRRLPYVLAGIGLGSAAAMLASPLALPGFICATALFFFFWNLGGPFQLGLATELDTRGQYLVLAPAFQAGGNMLGPAVAASLLSGQGYQPVSWFGGLCCVTSFAVFLVLESRAPGRRGRVDTADPS